MAKQIELNKPWLVAVWPGMGQVAISAGYYLMAKLGMHQAAEFVAEELFDIEHVEVEKGLIRPGRLPRSRLFVWQDPQGRRDIAVFIGEAQPPSGKRAFCRRLIDFAEKMGVERVFTFAAMGTNMHPERDSRVFGAAIDEATLSELNRLELEILQEGKISGLNGVLLGEAAERGLPGACLLGEMPGMFSQLPFPKASLAVLKAFTTIAGVDIDFTELSEQARAVDEQLAGVVEHIQQAMAQRQAAQEEEEEPWRASAEEEPSLSPEDEQLIENLFAQAEQDRSKAYELKRHLDRLEVFPEYEDRFLDLFKATE